jgi:hypothetical protein
MPEQLTPELVFDIFNIRRDGSNIVDDAEEDVVMGSPDSVSFSDKAKEVDSSIATLPPGVSLREAREVVDKAQSRLDCDPSATQEDYAALATMEEVVKRAEEKKETKPMSEKKEDDAAKKKVVDNKLFGDLFDDDVKEQVAPLKPETVEELPEEKTSAAPQQETSVSPDNKAQQPSATMSEVLGNDPKGHRWKLKSPAPKYEKLYEEKRDLLSNHLLKGGELPFGQFYQELNNASVDTNVPTWNTEEIGTALRKYRSGAIG